jgi:hypothetical protein
MIALRLALLACLGLIVAIRSEAYRNKLVELEHADISSRISSVLAAQGVRSWGQQVLFEDSLRAQVIEFQPAGCDAVAKVIPFSITLNSEAFLAMNEAQDWLTEMAHLDNRMPHLSQAHLVSGAVQAQVLDVLGHKATKWNRKALIIAAPPGCEVAFDMDLRAVWDDET